MKRRLPVLLLVLADLLAAQSLAGDWPQFRYDVGRTAASPHELPVDLQLRWTRTLPAPQPAFPHELRLRYDASYEPVVLGQTMFVPSMVNDSITALDTDTGEKRVVTSTGSTPPSTVGMSACSATPSTAPAEAPSSPSSAAWSR